MTCDIDKIKKDALDGAIKTFVGKAKSFTVNGNKISIPWSSTTKITTKDAAFKAAESNLNRVSKWAVKTFGPNFAEGWGSIYTGFTDSISVRLSVPLNLIQSYAIKKGEPIPQSLSQEELEANREDLASEPFTGLRPTINLNIDEPQGLSQQDFNELKEASVGVDKKGQIKLLHIGNNFQTKANNESIGKIREVLTKIGIKVETVDELVNLYGGSAVIETAKNLISLHNGMENVVLTEEAMHIISLMIPEVLYQDLENEITKYKIYKQTLRVYGNHPLYLNEDGTTNLAKIRLEAIGKLLAEYFIMKSENLTPKEVNIAKTLWGRITSWFSNLFKTNPFQEVINDLNTGKLSLTNQPVRSEILLSLALSPKNLEDLAKDINATAPKQTIDKISLAIKSISDDDIKIIWNNLNKVTSRPSNIVDRRVFAYSGNLVKYALDATDIHEEIQNSLAYIDSLLANTQTLTSEVDNIKRQLESGIQNEDGTYTPLTEHQELEAYKSIYFIHQIAETYREELDTFYKLVDGIKLSDGKIINDFKQVITDSMGQITVIKSNFETIRETEAKAILDKDVESKMKSMMSRLRTEIDILNTRLDRAETGKERRLLQKQIDKKQAQLDNPLSGETLFNMLADPSNASLYGMYHHYLDGPLTSKNPAIQQVANLIYNKLRESQKEAEPTVDRIIDIATDYFDRRGKRPTDINTFYDSLLETVKRVHFEPTTGELVEYEEIRFLSPYKQWEYENHIAEKLKEKHDLKRAIAAEIEPDVIEFLTTKLEEVNADLKKLYDDFGQDQYTAEYYEIQSKLNVTLSDGRTVADVRKALTEKLSKIDTRINGVVSQTEINSILDEKDDALFELMRLESSYNMNGTKKEGDDLIVAQTLTSWKALKREKEVDKWYITNSSKDRWQQDKNKIDSALAAAQEQVSQNPTNANIENYRIVSEEHETWYRYNTKETIPQEFYNRRAGILGAISILLEPYKGKSDTAKNLQQGIDDLWQDIFNITKGTRDDNGTIIGTDTLGLSTQVKYKEELIEEMKQLANRLKDRMNKNDFDTLKLLFKQLEEIQSNPLTPYWHQQVAAVKAKIQHDLIVAGRFTSPEQVDELFFQSDFFRDNTIDVTASMNNVVEVRDGLFLYNNRIFKPIYTWRHTVPAPQFAKVIEPSLRWYNYKVNPKFENPTHETIQGNIAISAAKAGDTYKNDRYNNLSVEDKQMLEQLREIHYTNQKTKAKKQREGDALPRVQADRTQRNKQRLLNAKDIKWKKIFSMETWNNFWDINPTKLQTEYGQGEAEDKGKVTVLAKFTDKSIPVTRQDKDIFKILTMSTIDAHRYSKMWELVPVLSTIREKASSDAQTGQKIDFIIDMFVNSKLKRDKGIARTFRQIQGVTQSVLALQWLGMPWMGTSILKNELQGLWQIAIMSPWLKQYSQGSLSKAIGASALRTWEVTAQGNMSTHTNKYTAIVKHLKLVASLDVNNTADTFKSRGLAAVDNTRFILGFTRQASEIHLELAMYELFKQSYKPWGDNKTIEDMYDFVDGKLTSKTRPVLDAEGRQVLDAEGLPVYEPIMTPAIEAEITTAVFNMHQFVAGNYSFSNSSLAKAYFWGSALLFMKNYFYNTSQALFGGERTLQNGQTMDGAYRVFWRLMRQNVRNLVIHKNLTPAEKVGLNRFYMHFLVVNIIGAAIGMLHSYLNEEGDDDEEGFLWYIANLTRKLYSEIAYFNVADRAMVIKQIGFGERDVSTPIASNNPGWKLAWYLVMEPAVNKVSGTFIPFDWKPLKYEAPIKTNDPYFSQYKDDLMMYNLMKSLHLKPEIVYPQSSLQSFLYYNESWYDPIKPKDEEDDQPKRTKRKGIKQNK